MKKTVIVFGLISGFIVTAFMIYAMARCVNNNDFESSGSMWLGYATMIIAFSFIFVGIKNLRDKYCGGAITFGKAFKTGLYITLIASTMYVVMWAIDYHFFIPDFMEKYSAHILEQAKAAGASAAELTAKTAEMEKNKEMYKNPLFFTLMTYAEIFPVGLIISLISALILKRKAKAEDVEVAN